MSETLVAPAEKLPLGPVHQPLRQPTAHRPAQDRLVREERRLETLRDPREQLDQTMIEKRHPALDRVSRRRPVLMPQMIVQILPVIPPVAVPRRRWQPARSRAQMGRKIRAKHPRADQILILEIHPRLSRAPGEMVPPQPRIQPHPVRRRPRPLLSQQIAEIPPPRTHHSPGPAG